MPTGKSNLYLFRMSCTQMNWDTQSLIQTTYEDMVARDIPFVCTDVDGKHDGYGVITDICLI